MTNMLFNYLHIVDRAAALRFDPQPLHKFKDARLEDEILDSRHDDHVEASDLDEGVRKSRDLLRQIGMDDYLDAEPSVIVLPNRSIASEKQNFGIVWSSAKGTDLMVVSGINSLELHRVAKDVMYFRPNASHARSGFHA